MALVNVPRICFLYKTTPLYNEDELSRSMTSHPNTTRIVFPQQSYFVRPLTQMPREKMGEVNPIVQQKHEDIV